jgi:hypothetical protein
MSGLGLDWAFGRNEHRLGIAFEDDVNGMVRERGLTVIIQFEHPLRRFRVGSEAEIHPLALHPAP